MSKYLFADAAIGSEVNYCGHRLEVKRNQGRCPECFFRNKICSGIACLSYERDDQNPVYFKEITNKNHQKLKDDKD